VPAYGVQIGAVGEPGEARGDEAALGVTFH
jgi:hypothetical protein